MRQAAVPGPRLRTGAAPVRTAFRACVARLFAGASELAMGKYVFAWLLGVPFGLLALIYVLAHI
jgi:hypothetical protein